MIYVVMRKIQIQFSCIKASESAIKNCRKCGTSWHFLATSIIFVEKYFRISFIFIFKFKTLLYPAEFPSPARHKYSDCKIELSIQQTHFLFAFE